MISTITSGPGITISTNARPYIANNGSQHTGAVHYNTINQTLEVFNGTSWVQLMGSVNIDIDGYMRSAIDWAYKKMEEERKLDAMCEKFPGLKKAREQYEMVLNLVKDEA